MGVRRHDCAPDRRQIAFRRHGLAFGSDEEDIRCAQVAAGAVKDFFAESAGKALLGAKDQKSHAPFLPGGCCFHSPQHRSLYDGRSDCCGIAFDCGELLARLVRAGRSHAGHCIDHRTQLLDGLYPFGDIGEAFSHEA